MTVGTGVTANRNSAALRENRPGSPLNLKFESLPVDMSSISQAKKSAEVPDRAPCLRGMAPSEIDGHSGCTIPNQRFEAEGFSRTHHDKIRV
jgi:hypothetical protein